MQTAWYIDEQNVTGRASDSNDGATIDTPLLTDAERQRRWGISPRLVQLRYDLYYLSDASSVVLLGRQEGHATMWIHGSATPYQGRTILASGTMTSRVIANEATNTRPSITGGPASANIASDVSPNKRLRLTSGVNTGAIAWAQRDEGGGVASVSQWINPAAWNPATFGVPPSVNPAGNETYVVEQLTKIDSLSIDITSSSPTAPPYVFLTVEGLYVPNIGTTEGVGIVFLGCAGVTPISESQQMFLLGEAVLMGCQAIASLVLAQMSLYACSSWHTWLPYSEGSIYFYQRTISEGAPLYNDVFAGGMTGIYNAAVFHSPTYGVRSTTGVIYLAGPFWGSNNAGPGLDSRARVMIISAEGGSVAALTIAGSSDFTVGGKTVARTWNDATGAYTEAGGVATRATTWANLAATIGAGGFAGNAIDVATGSAIVSI
jgi:hypothetical protein